MRAQELRAGRFGDYLRSLLSMEAQSPAPELGTQILPTLDVNSTAPEAAYLRTERLACGYYGLGAAGASNYNYIALRNPAGSGLIVTVQQIYASSTATETLYALMTNAAAVGAGTAGNDKSVRDSRWSNPLATVAEIRYLTSTTAPGAVPGRCLRIQSLANVALKLDMGFVLSPGKEFLISQDTVATPSLFVAFAWTERGIGELETARV